MAYGRPLRAALLGAAFFWPMAAHAAGSAQAQFNVTATVLDSCAVSAGDLMFTLVQLDEHIMPRSRKPSVFRGWQSQYLELLKQGDRRGIVESIQTIESIHPLLPWFDELVRRDADYFDLPKSYQW